MSDRNLELALHLHCLVEIVSAIGGATLDEVADLSAEEIQERVEFLRREVEDRILAMSPPPPPAPRCHPNRLDLDDLPF